MSVRKNNRKPEIKWEDDAILAINKPSGLLCLQDRYDASLPFLANILTPKFGPLMVVHRLDKETSGIMLLARNENAHHVLNDQFANKKVKKEYHALVRGPVSWDEITVDYPLRVNADRNHRTKVDTN